MDLVLRVCFAVISFGLGINAQFGGRRGGFGGQVGGPCGGQGWFFHNGVCYYIEQHTKATFEEARTRCRQKGASLYVPKNTMEYNTVMANTPAYGFSWIGLSQSRAFEPTWEVRNRVDYKQLNWLVKPYDAALNGFSQLSRCAVYYNANVDSGRYTYWKSCNDRNYFVCERNSGSGFGGLGNSGGFGGAGFGGFGGGPGNGGFGGGPGNGGFGGGPENGGFGGGPGNGGLGPNSRFGGPGNAGFGPSPGFNGAGNGGFGPNPGFVEPGNAGFNNGDGGGFGRRGLFGRQPIPA